jgi:hypothetical protein
MTKKAAKTKTRVLRVPLPTSVSGLLNKQQVCEAPGGCSTRKLDLMIAAGEFPHANSNLGRNPRWIEANHPRVKEASVGQAE